ncbi:MAG: BspA family leucine-rich repeat surface protein [Lachnospiraceae bacterium]|nr:BspA family leucine-rich repeat surface protein [Lachnospiraceae bacterium]
MTEKDFYSHVFDNDDPTVDLDVKTEICFSKKNLPKGEMVPVYINGKEEYVLIPLDAKDGSVVKVSGRGRHDYRSGRSGDLYVTVHIKGRPIQWKKFGIISVLFLTVILAILLMFHENVISTKTLTSQQIDMTELQQQQKNMTGKQQTDATTENTLPSIESSITSESIAVSGERDEADDFTMPEQSLQAYSNLMMSTYDFLGASEDYNTDHMHELEEAMSEKTFWGQSEIHRNEIKKVVFLDSMANKGENCWDVSATGDGSVIAWERDGILYVAADGVIVLGRSTAGLFSSFTNVTSIAFNNNVDTSQVTDMQDMFLGCWNLQTIDLSCFDTSNVCNMSSMFGSTPIQQLDVSMLDTSNVTSMAGMFANCENLQYLDLSNFNTVKVDSMSSMFGNCYVLSYVDLSSFNTENVSDMNGLFYRCYSLEKLDVSGFDTSKVKDMSWMFAACRMPLLDISGFEEGGLEDVTGMFRNSSIAALKCNSDVIQSAYDSR